MPCIRNAPRDPGSDATATVSLIPGQPLRVCLPEYVRVDCMCVCVCACVSLYVYLRMQCSGKIMWCVICHGHWTFPDASFPDAPSLPPSSLALLLKFPFETGRTAAEVIFQQRRKRETKRRNLHSTRYAWHLCVKPVHPSTPHFPRFFCFFCLSATPHVDEGERKKKHTTKKPYRFCSK